MSPGITYFPVASTIVAPGGTATLAPTAAILPPRISTVPPRIGGRVIVSTVPPRIAIGARSCAWPDDDVSAATMAAAIQSWAAVGTRIICPPSPDRRRALHRRTRDRRA